MRRLSAYIAQATRRPLPKEVAERAKHHLLDTLAAIACFCAASSAVYLVNDVRDLEADRQHPVKRHRPIATGDVSVRTAIGTAAALAIVAAIGAVLIDTSFALLIVGYLALQAAYSFGLKHQPVLDIAVVSSAGAIVRAGKNTASSSACLEARSVEFERLRPATPWSLPTAPNLWHEAQLASNTFRPASTSSTCCG